MVQKQTTAEHPLNHLPAERNSTAYAEAPLEFQKVSGAVKVSAIGTGLVLLLGGVRFLFPGFLWIAMQEAVLAFLLGLLFWQCRRDKPFLYKYGLTVAGALTVLVQGAFCLVGTNVFSGGFGAAALVVFLKTLQADFKAYEELSYLQRKNGFGFICAGIGALAGAWFMLDGKLWIAAGIFQSALLLGAADWYALARLLVLRSGLREAARQQIFFLNAYVPERLMIEKNLLLQNTGILTLDRVQVTNLVTYGTFSQITLLTLAASAMAASKQPLGGALLRLSEERGLFPAPAESFREEVGSGVEASVQGSIVQVGNRHWLESLGISAKLFSVPADQLEKEGKLPVFVSVDREVKGVLGILYPISPEAMQVLQKLGQKGFLVEVFSEEERQFKGVRVGLSGEELFDIRLEDKNPKKLLQAAAWCEAMVKGIDKSRVGHLCWFALGCPIAVLGCIFLPADQAMALLTGITGAGTVLCLASTLLLKRFSKNI